MPCKEGSAAISVLGTRKPRAAQGVVRQWLAGGEPGVRVPARGPRGPRAPGLALPSLPPPRRGTQAAYTDPAGAGTRGLGLGAPDLPPRDPSRRSHAQDQGRTPTRTSNPAPKTELQPGATSKPPGLSRTPSLKTSQPFRQPPAPDPARPRRDTHLPSRGGLSPEPHAPGPTVPRGVPLADPRPRRRQVRPRSAPTHWACARLRGLLGNVVLPASSAAPEL